MNRDRKFRCDPASWTKGSNSLIEARATPAVSRAPIICSVPESRPSRRTAAGRLLPDVSVARLATLTSSDSHRPHVPLAELPSSRYNGARSLAVGVFIRARAGNSGIGLSVYQTHGEWSYASLGGSLAFVASVRCSPLERPLLFGGLLEGARGIGHAEMGATAARPREYR